MKKKRGFTLVELLAVIVILAVILIIAMPKISEVINNSKKASFEATAKTIASQAEKKYMENEVLGNTGSFECSDVVKLNNTDYASCNITFDDKGNALVTLNGSGKFAGLTIKNATKNSATATELTETAAKYFSYDVNASNEMNYYDITVTDLDKCVAYLMKAMNDTSDEAKDGATTLCNGGTVGEVNLSAFVSSGDIPSSDYETAGLKVNVLKKYLQIDEGKCASYLTTIKYNPELCTSEENIPYLPYLVTKSDHDKAGITLSDKPNETVTITGYSVAGGLDVVIPSMIDGKTVVAIGDYAFTTRGVIPTLTAYNNDYKVSLLSYNSNNNYVIKSLAAQAPIEGLGITSVVIPNTVTSIGRGAFEVNKLTNVEIPSSVTTIKVGAFEGNKLTNVEIPSSITRIGDYAFADNKITLVKFPSTPISIGCRVFYGNPIMEDSSYSFPSNVTEVCK